jgi:O-antigen ligase
MRNRLVVAMVAILVLCLAAGLVCFGAVQPDLAAPMFSYGFILALFWLGKLLWARPMQWKHSPMHWPVIAFMIYATVRYFTASIEYEARFELMQVLFFGLVYFIIACNFHRSRDRSIFLVCLAVLAVADSAYGIWQYLTGSNWVLHLGRVEIGRGSGTYICPNHLAGFLEMVLGLLLTRVALTTSRPNSLESTALQKVFGVYAILMVLVGILVTFSRGGWIVTFLGLVLFFLWGDWRVRAGWPRMALGALTLAALLTIGLKVLPHRLSVDRMLTTDEQTKSLTIADTTLGGRTYLWKASLRIIRDYPLFGTGPGSWRWFQAQYRDPRMQENPDYAHQDVLNLTSDYGIVGLLLVVAALACYYWHALLLVRRSLTGEQRAFAMGSVISVTMILLHSWVDFNLHVPANALLLVMIMGFTVAMEDSAGRFPHVELRPGPRYGLALAVLLLCLAAGWFVPRTSLAYYRWSRGTDSKLVLHYENALTRYGEAVHLDRKFPDPYNATGDIYERQATWMKGGKEAERTNRLEDAVAFYRMSLFLNDRQTRVVLRLARVYELLGQNDRALVAYERALDLDPRSAFVFERLGYFYRNSGDKQRAADAFEKSTKLYYDRATAINLSDLRQGNP